MVSLIVWHKYEVTWSAVIANLMEDIEARRVLEQVPQVLKTADYAFTVIHLYITPVLNTHDYMRLNTYTCTKHTFYFHLQNASGWYLYMYI